MTLHDITSTGRRIRCLGVALFWAWALPVLALGPPHDATNDIGCNSCHAAHGGGFGFKPEGAQQTALCASCHNESGQASSMIDIGTEEHGGNAANIVDCGFCHDVHDTQNGANIRLIRTNTTKYVSQAADPVVFEATPGDFARSAGPPYTGICQTCHLTAAYHRSDGTGGTQHEAGDPDTARGGNCAACHAHVDSFAPVGGTSCTGCHSTARGSRRPVVADFSLASHHADAVTDADCQVCHDQSAHKAGSVKLFDVDTGTTAATLAADPAGDSTEAAKLEAVCLPCHDSDGAGGSLPFSDSVAPPIIDSTAWSSSSHKGGSITCYGDGATFGCHASGHGSEKAKLRAPSAGAPVPPDNLAEEEGFCFACHDSDGPAASDINTAFARTYHHPINNSDANRPGNGRDVECRTCHNPHVAASTPAHTNSNAASGLIAGVAGVNASGSPVSSVTYEYELCFLCHANYAGAGSNPGDGGPDPTSNKATQFDPANATFHPVRAAQDNAYAAAHWDNPDRPRNFYITMEAPWNQTDGVHDAMWCSDCHRDPTASGPHGSNTPKMLVAGLSAVETSAGSGDWHTPLCITCHKKSVYVDGDNGSRFSAHNNNNHRKPDYTKTSDGTVRYGGCLSCHYGGGPATPVDGAHGGNHAFGFVNGNSIANWVPGTCVAIDGDGSTCGGHSKGY